MALVVESDVPCLPSIIELTTATGSAEPGVLARRGEALHVDRRPNTLASGSTARECPHPSLRQVWSCTIFMRTFPLLVELPTDQDWRRRHQRSAG